MLLLLSPVYTEECYVFVYQRPYQWCHRAVLGEHSAPAPEKNLITGIGWMENLMGGFLFGFISIIFSPMLVTSVEDDGAYFVGSILVQLPQDITSSFSRSKWVKRKPPPRPSFSDMVKFRNKSKIYSIKKNSYFHFLPDLFKREAANYSVRSAGCKGSTGWKMGKSQVRDFFSFNFWYSL